MKTSLSYLPQIKQDQILHIVEIIRSIVDPEKVILFGSYAKNSYKEHRYRDGQGAEQEFRSDYDILVVTKDNPHNTNEIDNKITAQIPNNYPELNLEIHEIDYINEGLEFGQYFFSDIVKEGVLLFDTDAVKFANPKELSNSEKKIIAQRFFDIWFTKGSNFLDIISPEVVAKDIKIAAFLLHQSAESFYYTILLVFTEYKPKTHNLRKLRKQSKVLSEELYLIFPIETDKKSNHLFDLLKRGYIDARYRHDYAINLSEIDQLIVLLKSMRDLVKTLCQKRLVELDS